MNPTPDIADHRARILIVDDERHNRELLEVMLAPEGFLLLTAASGEEALAIVAKQPPDLILLDVMMPGMDGYQVAAKIKGNLATKNIPVIIVTARDDQNARMLGLSAGAEEFLSRPVDRAELRVRVKNLLRLKAYGDYYDKYSQMLEGEVGSRTANLVASERLYRSTFDAAPVGIVHVGLDGQWLRVNQRLCDLLGYSRKELQGSAAPELLQSEGVAGDAESFRQMAAGALDRYVVEKTRYRRRDGSFMWARINVSVHRDAEGQAEHFISVIEDTTERVQIEAQFRQAQKMESVGQLASGIAHDFNNLLTVINGMSDLVLAQVSQDDPVRADVQEILHAGERAATLTRQLLAFSRRQILELRVLSLNTVVAGMESLLRRLLGEDIDLVFVPTPGLGHVKADPGQIEQVMANLAVNARDAMPQGGQLTIETQNVTIDETYARQHGVAMPPGPYVQLTVSDTGVGMDEATRAHIFEPFFTTKGPGKGTGLGLSTVYGIVKQSQGFIWVYSEMGRGTSFRMYLPHVAEAAGTERPGGTVVSSSGTETILLAEDNAGVRKLVTRLLEPAGYTVLAATTGEEALRLLERHEEPVHLLLSDVVMPGMSGRQLAEQLAQTRPGMKVLFMSGYTSDTIVRHGVLEAQVPFLNKPFTAAALLQKVREVLDSEA